MTGRQRIVLLLIAAVVLAGGIALAASGGDDDEPAETTAQTTTVTPPGEDGPTTTTETTAPPPPRVRIETIRIRDGGPVGGEQTFEYERGDTIRLRFVSDVPGEVHIHGFDRYVDVSPRLQVTRFKATLEGIFEVEEHGSGEILAKLEIRPK